VDAIKTLVGFGANVCTPNNEGYTPVWAAAKDGYVNVIRLLYKRGADMAPFTTAYSSLARFLRHAL
jgi:ankyrin repeat protein